MKYYCNLILSTFVGLLILFSCQSNNESIKPTSEANEATIKTVPDHFDRVIGHLVNEEFQLSDSIDYIVSYWEDLINNCTSLDISFDAVNIEIDNDMYFLVGVDDSEDATSVVRLVLDSGVFYEYCYPDPTEMSVPTGSTCTCSGCKSTGPLSVNDCQPKQNELGWYCTDCPRGMGECVKTVTATSGGGTLGS